ncbi:MAG: hypothetical protein ACKVN9_10130 [Methylophilaceae bacterium]
MRITLSSVLRWTLPISLAAMAVAYSIYRRGDIQYWDGAVGNWLATLLGIVAGVPVALFLDRRRAASEISGKEQEVQRVRRDMLTLLQAELGDAATRLAARVELKDSIPIDPMKMSIWDAMRDSGNLTHISEPELISAIADAYRTIAVISDREKHIMQVSYGATVRFPDGETAGMKLLRETAEFYLPAAHNIEKAMIAISKTLQEPHKKPVT